MHFIIDFSADIVTVINGITRVVCVNMVNLVGVVLNGFFQGVNLRGCNLTGNIRAN